MENNLNHIQKQIGVNFSNQELLKLALTHKSYAIENNNNKNYNNERLEFLGDSVLSIIVSTYIYNKYSDIDEGELSKIRSKLVCKDYCCNYAKTINLGDYLLLGKGESASLGKLKTSNLANAFEALLGAIYLDKGLEFSEKFIFKFLKDVEIDNLYEDYKSKLQEIVQKKYRDVPIYELKEESGPAHERNFMIEVKVLNKAIGFGQGKTKKKAEQIAAKNALETASL